MREALQGIVRTVLSPSIQRVLAAFGSDGISAVPLKAPQAVPAELFEVSSGEVAG